jgi:hypothetical protein
METGTIFSTRRQEDNHTIMIINRTLEAVNMKRKTIARSEIGKVPLEPP